MEDTSPALRFLYQGSVDHLHMWAVLTVSGIWKVIVRDFGVAKWQHLMFNQPSYQDKYTSVSGGEVMWWGQERIHLKSYNLFHVANHNWGMTLLIKWLPKYVTQIFDVVQISKLYKRFIICAVNLVTLTWVSMVIDSLLEGPPSGRSKNFSF